VTVACALRDRLARGLTLFLVSLGVAVLWLALVEVSRFVWNWLG